MKASVTAPWILTPISGLCRILRDFGQLGIGAEVAKRTKSIHCDHVSDSTVFRPRSPKTRI